LRSARLPGIGRARTVTAGALALTFLSTFAASSIGGARPASAEAAYAPIPLDTNGVRSPFDLGAADIDRDGDLDLYGTNHNQRAPFLINDGSGNFEDRLGSSGFAQIAAIPGFEDGGRPEFDRPGLYIYTEQGKKLAIRRVGGQGRVEGSVRAPVDFFGPKTKGDAEAVEVSEEEDPRYRRVEFSLGPGGEVRGNPRFIEVPIEIEVDGIAPSEIFLGPRRVNPPETSLTLNYRDRHSVLWAQLGGGPATDALVVRGGIKGVVEEISDLIEDELLIAGEGGYAERAAEAGLSKDGCRGRGIRPADLGADGDVDVLIECEGADPLLYEQTGPGRFEDRGDLLAGIDAADQNLRWVAMRGPGQPQLLVSRRGQFDLYEIGEAGTELIESVPGDGLVKVVSAGDYDGDGDQDLFASAEGGNTLLRNSGEGYVPIQPEELGLPKRGLSASWVDADNDGRLDLHDYQRGLYIQDGRGRFDATGEVPAGSESKLPAVARAIWLDTDNDGDREVVVAERADDRGASSYRAFERRGGGGHWLELELEGRGQGLDAIGSAVAVQAGPVASRTALVGESEGSRYSWGHSRLYFGLGNRRRVDRLTIDWTGGERSVLEDVRADRLLTLRQGSQRLQRLELATVDATLRRVARGAGRSLSRWTTGQGAAPETS
jgi:hypothetical protein